MIALYALAWCGGALALALFLGRVIRNADCCPCNTDDDDTWLDDQPVECLSDEEIRLRCERLEAWL